MTQERKFINRTNLGSGTQGIEQLSELSNVRVPGVWLYRVDRSVIDACIQPQLQPPYCDDQSPTLITRPPFQQQTTTPGSRSNEVSRNLPDEPFEQTIIPETFKPQTSLPSLIEVPIGPEDLLEDSFAFSSRESELPTTTTTRRPIETTTVRRRPTPAFPTVQTQRVTEQRPTTTQARRVESTSHQPIVAFKSTEFNEIPPDAFEATFPPFITVIPSVFKPDDAVNSREHVTQDISPSSTSFKNSKELTTPTEHPNDSQTFQSRHDNSASSPEFNPHNFPQPPGNDHDNEGDEMEVSHRMEILETTNTPLTSLSASDVMHKTTENVTKSVVIQPASDATPIFLFSTIKPTSPKKILQTKNKLVTAFTVLPKKDDDDVLSMPFDENRVLDAEMSSSRLAILIPVTIVAVWLLILIVIAVVLCCQRRFGFFY